MVTSTTETNTIVTERSGAIQIIEFNRPEKKNAVTFAMYDAVVVCTAHDAFKDPALYRGVRLVIDSRNAVAPLFGSGGGPRIVRA